MALTITTYPRAVPSVLAVDHWAFRGVANSLQDGSLSRICPSDDEDSELDLDLWRLHFFLEDLKEKSEETGNTSSVQEELT